MEVSIDLADALQAAINASGHDASASPLPGDFDSHLPFTRVTTLEGGTRIDRVIDARTALVETWAERMDEAVAECNAVVGVLCDLEGQLVGGVPCYRTDVYSLPAEDHDPYHKDLSMASATVRVLTRVRHI